MEPSTRPIRVVPRISMRHVSVELRGFVLGPLSLDLFAAETVALVGANGAGKTTLLRTLTGQVQARGGSISLDANPVDPVHPSWRNRIGYVPDDPEELIAECTALEFWRFHAAVRATVRSGRSRRQRVTAYLERAHHYAGMSR